MFFADALAQHPEALALTDGTRTRSWQALNDNVLRLTQWLRAEKQVQPGEHIALVIGNRVEFIECMFAGFAAGVWITPVNTHLLPHEVRYIIADSGARLVLTDAAHVSLIDGLMNCDVIDIESLYAELPGLPNATIAPKDEAGGTMLYTSGTTGKPKGVKRAKPASMAALVTQMKKTGALFGLDGHGTHLVTGPLYHAAPMLFALYDMANGAAVVIMPKWDCDAFAAYVARYGITHTHLVPTMFVRLLHWRDAGNVLRHASLTHVLHGAAPIAPDTKRAMIDWWGPILTEYWGASEAGTTTLVGSEEWLTHPGTVGKPLAHFAVYVGDKEGNPSAEKTGMLYCRHRDLAQVFTYHNDAEKTRKAHPQPHVFCIGDIGFLDDGYVYLADRESNMIISGGVNIYPAEIEQALLGHPAVADVAVFGVPSVEWGEDVKAVVELREGVIGDSALREALVAFLADKLARYKQPRTIEFTDALPRTPTGKIRVHELKARWGRPAGLHATGEKP